MCKSAKLDDRAVIAVSGKDARIFLHGIITNSMEKARDGRAVHAGLLTPQGKMMFDFFILPVDAGDDEKFLCDCPVAVKDDLIKRLTFYRLRAAVVIADRSADFDVYAIWDGAPEQTSGTAFADPRLCPRFMPGC